MEMCIYLIGLGTDVNYVEELDVFVCGIGSNALHGATEMNHLSLCELLINRGSLVDVVNQAGNTSLQLASRKGNYEVCKLLLKNGAERRDW
mmetsp:Transcript_29632/g.34888  ORF Transcript_29632/g.34888 Transcript_29632/m.34888 type:complete len:91 (+) Transcript_29632:289-561(+)